MNTYNYVVNEAMVSQQKFNKSLKNKLKRQKTQSIKISPKINLKRGSRSKSFHEMQTKALQSFRSQNENKFVRLKSLNFKKYHEDERNFKPSLSSTNLKCKSKKKMKTFISKQMERQFTFDEMIENKNEEIEKKSTNSVKSTKISQKLRRAGTT